MTYVAPQTPQSQGFECAPWEDNGFINGTPGPGSPRACTLQTYPWMNLPAGQAHPSVWTPAPDACAPVSSNWNSGKVPTSYVMDKDHPAPNPACDGSATPPNCDAANPVAAENPACGGTPTVPAPWFDKASSVTMTCSATITVTDAKALTSKAITESATAYGKPVKQPATVTVSKKVKGKKFTQSATVAYQAPQVGNATITKAVTAPTLNVTDTATWTVHGGLNFLASPTSACNEAKKVATSKAQAQVATQVATYAQGVVAAEAQAAAVANVKPTTDGAAFAAAKAKAKKIANAKLAKKIKQAKKKH